MQPFGHSMASLAPVLLVSGLRRAKLAHNKSNLAWWSKICWRVAGVPFAQFKCCHGEPPTHGKLIQISTCLPKWSCSARRTARRPRLLVKSTRIVTRMTKQSSENGPPAPIRENSPQQSSIISRVDFETDDACLGISLVAAAAENGTWAVCCCLRLPAAQYCCLPPPANCLPA